MPYINKGLQSIQDLKDKIEFTRFIIKGLGRIQMKALGLNPDSICQISLQLAYYRIYGVLPVLWQSYGMRHYRYGRIEVIRSTSEFSTKLIQLMASSS